MTRKEPSAYRRLFPQNQIPIILSSIFKASSTLRKNTINDREDWITRRLCTRLVKIPTYRDGPLCIHLKEEIISSDLDAGTAAGEVDFRVSCGLGYEVYFVVEAKRLRVRLPNGQVKSGNSEYIKDGMMRFVTGQYAPLMEASAMLGYVFDGEIAEARSAIDKAVQDKAQKLRLKPPKGLTPSGILPGKPVDETVHDLGARSFTLYHVFVAV